MTLDQLLQRGPNTAENSKAAEAAHTSGQAAETPGSRSVPVVTTVAKQGNMVHAPDQNGLPVITQQQPIAVLCSIPEDDLPQVLTKMRSGQSLIVDA